ncbi:MAG: ABC transporter ATP-binding protein [Spirochaetales bacterium]|nr:ABC transporter ATP-binding protein [Spirochaetales bacterium]
MKIRRSLKLLKNINTRWPLLITAYVLVLLITGVTLVNPLLFAFIIDHVLLKGETNYLIPILLLGLGIAVFNCVFSIVKDTIFRYLDINYTLDLRDAALRHLRKIPILEIEKTGPTKFQNFLGLDTAMTSNFITRILVEWFSNASVLFISLGIVFFMDWKLGSIAILFVIFLIFFPRFFKRPLLKYSQKVREHNEENGSYLLECMEGSKEIRILGLEDWESKRNKIMYKGIIKVSTLDSLFRSVSNNMSGLIISIIIIAIYWMGSYLTGSAVISIGLFVAVVSYLNNSLFRVLSINSFYGDLQATNLAIQRLDDFLQSPVEAHFRTADDGNGRGFTPTAAPRVDDSPGEEEPKALEIMGLNVTVGNKRIISDMNVSIEKNKKIAFVGLSGSGKTSFYKTLLGFMPVESGEIFVFGENTKTFSRDRINSMMGVVFQDSFIFKGTIHENILIGNLQATEEEVYAAACNANLKPLLDKLPQGIFTSIHNKGLDLSGGERQRIAIARTFLKKPQILLLDEPTSALDQLSEYYVIDALDKLMAKKTTLISTHRLGTIKNADLIVLLDNGRIVDSGTHDELMNQSALYYTLVTHYQKEGENAAT